MNKKLIIPIAVILFLLLLGLIGFFLTRSGTKKTTSVNQTGNQAESQPTGQATQKQSLKSLMGSAVNQSCEFSDDQSGNSGKVYVSAGQVRGDFANVVNGEATSSHMYSDGKTMYIWMEGSNIGYKNSITDAEGQSPAPTGTQTKTNVDVNQQADFKCRPWSADDSMFKLPTGVEFKDLKAMMIVPTGSSVPGAGNASKCSACDALSGDAKTQCLSALGC